VQNWLKISRDCLESLEARGRINPFRKHKRAKAWYPKWQLSCEFLLPEERQNKMPSTVWIRRADALAWLGIPAAEFESWVRLRIISAIRLRSAQSKARYVVREIKMKILGLGR